MNHGKSIQLVQLVFRICFLGEVSMLHKFWLHCAKPLKLSCSSPQLPFQWFPLLTNRTARSTWIWSRQKGCDVLFQEKPNKNLFLQSAMSSFLQLTEQQSQANVQLTTNFCSGKLSQSERKKQTDRRKRNSRRQRERERERERKREREKERERERERERETDESFTHVFRQRDTCGKFGNKSTQKRFLQRQIGWFCHHQMLQVKYSHKQVWNGGSSLSFAVSARSEEN